MKNKLYVILILICALVFAGLAITDICLYYLANTNSVILKIIEIIIASITSSFSVNLTIKNSFNKCGNSNASNKSSIAQVTVGNDSNVGSIILAPKSTSEFSNEVIKIEADLETLKKENIDAIVSIVMNRLKTENISQPIDKDFLIKYINDGATISDYDIQKIWASLLVAKVTGDSSVTKRLLDIVKNLSPYEASIFEKVARKSANDGTIFEIFKKDIPFIELSLLIDVGLLKSHDHLSQEMTFSKSRSKMIIARNNNIAIVGIYNGQEDYVYSLNCSALTSEGTLLKSALGLEMADDDIIVFAKKIKEENHNKKIGISAHRIIEINKEMIRFENDDILQEDKKWRF